MIAAVLTLHATGIISEKAYMPMPNSSWSA